MYNSGTVNYGFDVRNSTLLDMRRKTTSRQIHRLAKFIASPNSGE